MAKLSAYNSKVVRKEEIGKKYLLALTVSPTGLYRILYRKKGLDDSYIPIEKTKNEKEAYEVYERA